MAMTMTLLIPGADTATYDELNRRMGIPESMPSGLRAHYASQTPDGLRVFDVWETREAFEEFFPKVGAAMAEVMGGEPPQVEPEFGELHNQFPEP